MALFGKPRVVRLAEVASRAELLRRRRQVRGAAVRAALGTTAAVFALLMLVWLHLTAWAALDRSLGAVGAAFALGALDLAVVLGLGALAGRHRTDPVADEAVTVRNTALQGAEMEVRTLGGLLRPSSDEIGTGKRRVRVYPTS